MAGNAQLAKLSALWMGDYSAGTPDKAFAFEGYNRGVSKQLIDTGENAAWGTLDHPERRVVENFRRANPRIELVPNPTEWENILQWVQGGTPSATSAGGTDTITYPRSNVALERSIVHSDGFLPILINGVAANRTTIRGVQQQEVRASIECVGRDWSVSGVPTPTARRSTLPSYIFSELVFSVAGVNTYKCRSFELSIFKNIDPDRYFNSKVLTGIIARDQITTLRADLPWGLHYALWQAGAASGGVAVQLAFVVVVGATTYTLQVDMPAMRANVDPVDYRVPEETYLVWEAQAFAPDSGAPNFNLSDSITFTLTRPTP